MNEVEGEAVAGAEGDGATRAEGWRDLALEDGGNHLVGEEHEHHVIRGSESERDDFEPSERPRSAYSSS